MIDITQFCSGKDPRDFMMKPWRSGNWIVASNGHVIVLVPDEGGEYAAEPEVMEGKIAKFEAEYLGGIEWLDVSSITLPDPVKCTDCSGSGYLYVMDCLECDGEGEFEHGSHDYECKECDGAGQVTSKWKFDDSKKEPCARCRGSGTTYQPVKVGNTFAQRQYIEKLAKLPNCRLSPDGDHNPMPFVFDGGRGWLMPCRG